MNIQTNLRSGKWYFSSLLMVLSLGVLLLLLNGKTTCFIAMNNYHVYWLDVFFINYTFIGDGLFAIMCIVVYYFHFKQKQQGVAMLISFIIIAIIVQVAKNLFSSPRPKLFFSPGQYTHFIEGVSIANHASFPSGHTACAFAIATVMVLMANNKITQLLLLTAAILAGYSRIYLGQHFLLDVIVGAVIGTASGITGFYIAINMKPIKIFNQRKNRKENEQIAGTAIS